jgi:CRP/FNR family transcriptional regulator, cyclic AMP receptor protein
VGRLPEVGDDHHLGWGDELALRAGGCLIENLQRRFYLWSILRVHARRLAHPDENEIGTVASAGDPRHTGRVVKNRADLLRSIPMFEGLDDQDVEDLASELQERRIPSGELLFDAGEAGDTMYIVAEGVVNIHLPGDPATRVSLADLTVGKYFGEVALFDDKPRSASAQAMTEVVLLELGRDVLTRYLERRPRAAMAILRTMADRLRQTNAMLSERAARNVIEEFEKGLSWADRLADRVAELNGSWSFILVLAGLTVGWILINVPGLMFEPAPDGYPYQFFNLLLAVLVALQGPLIVMSQNRQAAKDRKEAETDFKVNLKNEVNIETILKELREFRALAAGRRPPVPPTPRKKSKRDDSPESQRLDA